MTPAFPEKDSRNEYDLTPSALRHYATAFGSTATRSDRCHLLTKA